MDSKQESLSAASRQASALRSGRLVFFWKPEQANGEFGNWWVDEKQPIPISLVEWSNIVGKKDHPAPLRRLSKDGNTILFVCSEQAMMAWKACVCNDPDTLDAIMKHKALGRKVQNYFEMERKWPDGKRGFEHAYRSATTEILKWKFSSNDSLQRALLSTGNATLVEASPYDKRWGIGLKADDPRAQDPSKWKKEAGRDDCNWLGQALMAVRARLGGGGQRPAPPPLAPPAPLASASDSKSAKDDSGSDMQDVSSSSSESVLGKRKAMATNATEETDSPSPSKRTRAATALPTA